MTRFLERSLEKFVAHTSILTSAVVSCFILFVVLAAALKTLIFNPVLQARRFDPEARYIKTYIPELSGYPAHMLHDPLKYEHDYFKPLVNHYERAAYCKAAFSRKRIS